MMRKVCLLIFLAIFWSVPLFSQEDLQLPRVSQKASVSQTIGLTDVTITYNRPGVKERTIWGELVPYDKVWRTGANEATTISFSRDVKIEGQALPAGRYSLHTIPGKTEWTVIFNKDAKQWGSYSYDQSKDAARVKVKPQRGDHVEWLRFSFADISMNSGTVEIAWEKARVPFKIEADTEKQAMANIEKSLSGEVKDWEKYYDAAAFVFRNGNTAKALEWINQSVGLKETYWNMRLKADILAKTGKTEEAISVAEKAVQLGKANQDEPGEVAKTEKQIADWKSSLAKN